MRNRSVSQRNLLGAFVGGMLGILTFGYFDNTALMVIACFAGVIGGWWYQELWQSTVYGFNEGVVLAKQVSTFLFNPARKLREWCDDLKQDVGDADFLYLFAVLMIPFVWLLRRPVAIAKWALAHPLNQVYLIRMVVVTVFYTVCTVFIVSLGYLYYEINPKEVVMVNAFIGVGLLCLVLVSLTLPMMAWENNAGSECHKMKIFYRTWAYYLSVGPMRFFAAELLFLFKTLFATIVLATVCFAWLIGTGAVLLAISATASAAIGLVKGIYQVSMRAGHWLCFGVTLVVTATAAWIGHGHLGDVRILWAVALLTGVMSALITEGIRRSFIWAFYANRVARAVALVPLGKRLLPGGNLFMRANGYVADWLSELLLPKYPQQYA